MLDLWGSGNSQALRSRARVSVWLFSVELTQLLFPKDNLVLVAILGLQSKVDLPKGNGTPWQCRVHSHEVLAVIIFVTLCTLLLGYIQ